MGIISVQHDISSVDGMRTHSKSTKIHFKLRLRHSKQACGPKMGYSTT